MIHARYSSAMTDKIHQELQDHLLQHYRRGLRDEDLCFALYRPSAGLTRMTALIEEVIIPTAADRTVHGNVSFNASFITKVIGMALEKGAGIAFLHSHPFPGWQDMSRDDILAETMLAPRVQAVTGLPLVGLTVGDDGVVSARFWEKENGKYKRIWCESVRVVGPRLQIFYAPFVPKPEFKEELRRTYSAWGNDAQSALARIRAGVIGVGSVGQIILEGLARQGTKQAMGMDFDIVKRHNLDRLLHATAADIGKLKTEVIAKRLAVSATADDFEFEPLDMSVCTPQGFKAALDRDMLFSAVDRPWPRAVLNMIANAHLIPVIDGGISVRITPKGRMRGADWRAHVVRPGSRCMECLRQYDPADVALERTGLLEDSKYIEGLSPDHFIHGNQNVFTFALNAAGLMLLKFIQMVVGPSGIFDSGAQMYNMSLGQVRIDEKHECDESCPYRQFEAKGDHVGIDVIG